MLNVRLPDQDLHQVFYLFTAITKLETWFLLKKDLVKEPIVYVLVAIRVVAILFFLTRGSNQKSHKVKAFNKNRYLLLSHAPYSQRNRARSIVGLFIDRMQ